MTKQPRRKLSARTRQALEEAIRLGLTYEQAADVAGVDVSTLRVWRSEEPALSAALERAASEGVQARLARIEAAAQQGSWQADAWWLERKHPQQWGRQERMQVEHSGHVSVQQAVALVAEVLETLLADVPEAIRSRMEQALIAASEQLQEGGDDGGG